MTAEPALNDLAAALLRIDANYRNWRDTVTTNTETTNTETKTARAQCRMTTAKGERCTGESLDPDPKAVQVCQRHAAEVMALIADHRKRART
ncbi:hypothetical protein ACFQZ2_01680 [Streptomonospora algeriensis]|uniref:Uncharacterized protein n=1 Tax=Streptomonospora algeriensis TaxID=995084 RepID=A0ABW3BDR2_9ACTN